MKSLLSPSIKNRLLTVLPVVAFLLTSTCHAKALTTVAYASVPGVPGNQTSIDLYPCPLDSKALVVYVHGGGWTRGDKANVHSMSSFFADNKICFASANYPLSSPDGKALMDHQVEALSRLNSWLQGFRKRGSENPAYRNISIIGHSAGAQLVALAEMRYGWNQYVNNIFLMDSAAYDLRSKFQELSQRYRAELSKIIRLDRYSPGEYTDVLKRYSPALLMPPPRKTENRLNVFLLTSRRPAKLQSAEALKQNYESSTGYRVAMFELPWKHQDFPRRIGVDPVFSQRLLREVLRNSPQ